MFTKLSYQPGKRFVYKRSHGTQNGHVRSSREVVDDVEGEVGKGNLSVEDLFALRKDKEGLAAFVHDYAEIEEEKKEQERAALEKSAVERLMLAQQVDRKKTDESEMQALREKVEEDGVTFTEEFFSLVHDESLDMDDKVKKIDHMLGKFEDRVEAKAREEQKHKGVLDSLQRGKAFILSSILGLSVFKLLPELWQKKVKDMENNPDITAEDVAKQTSEIIKKETGEDIDLTDLMIAHSFSGAEEAANEGAVEAAGEAGELASQGVRGAIASGETSMIDWVKNSIGMIQGNVYAHSFGSMAKACGVSKSALFACTKGEDMQLQTVGDLKNRVEGVTYEGLLKAYDGNAKKAQKAWENLEQWQKIVAWLDANSQKIKDLIDKAIDRLPNLNREDQEQLKSEMDPDNMRVAQVAFAMFGDHDLMRDWLIRTPAYISRSWHFYKVTKRGLSGALVEYLQPHNGHRASVAAHSEEYAAKARKIELDLSNDLGIKGLGENAKKGTFGIIEDLKADIQAYDLKGERLNGTSFAERNKRVDAFQKTVGTVEERFKAIANELGKQGETLRGVQKSAGNLAGKTLADLRIDAETKQLMTRWLGGSFDEAMSLETAFAKIKVTTAEKITSLARVQKGLNREILGVRDMLKTRVLEPFDDLVKLQLRSKTVTEQTIAEIRKTSGNLIGETKYWAPKLAMPVFGVGISLWQGIKQKQGVKKTALAVTEAGLSFVPYVGGIMDVSLGINGYDLAGNTLSTMERVSYVGFGALGFVADLFGGYAIRAGLATVIKGRRGIKAVAAVGKEESLIMRAGKSVSELGNIFNKPKRLAHTRDALRATTEAADILRNKVLNGTASWMDKWKLGRLDAKASSLGAKETRLASQVSTDAALKQGSRAIKEAAIKAHGTGGKMFGKVLGGLEKMSVPAMLALVISQGNVTPADLGEYAVEGTEKVAEGAAWGMGQFFKGGERRIRAVDEMIADYVKEKQMEEAIRTKAEEEGSEALAYMGEHMDLPQVATVAARSGLSGTEFTRSDSGSRLAEALGA